MTIVKNTPSPEEVARVVTSDAYYHAVDAVSHMGLFDTSPDTFIIGPGTDLQVTIRLNSDGTLDFPSQGNQIRLRHYPAKRDATVFYTVWQSLLAAAHNALSHHLNQTFTKQSINHIAMELDNQCANAAKGVRSTLKRGYLQNPSGLGYAALADFIGRDRIRMVLSIAGAKATLKDFNTIIKDKDIFQEAKTTNPNAVLLWFKEHFRYSPHTTYTSAADIISQAETYFAEALRKINPDRIPQPIWQTMTKLNHEGTARYLLTPINVAQTATDAHDAGANPSFTAIRVLASTARATGRTSTLLAHAFIRESERRSLTRGKPQRELAAQYQAIENPHHTISQLPRTPPHIVSIMQDALQDLLESSDTMTPVSWQQIIDAMPQEALEVINTPNRKTRKPRKPGPTTPGPTYLKTHDLDSILDGPAKQAVDAALLNAITISTHSGSSTEIRQADTPTPLLKVWRTDKGAINFQAKNYMVDGPLPNPRHPGQHLAYWTTRGLKTNTATQAVGQYLEDHWHELAPNPNTKMPSRQRLNSHIHTRLQDESRQPPAPSDQKLSEQLLTAVASLLDQEVYDLADTVSNCVDIDTYNFVNSAKDTIQDLLHTNPGAVTWVMTNQRPAHAPKHPGEFIATAKNTLIRHGLEPRNWRATATISPGVIKAINNPETEYHHRYQTNNNRHKTFLLNVIAASHTRPSPETASTALEIIPSLLAYRTEDLLQEHQLRNARTFLILLIREGITQTTEEIISARDYLQHVNHNAGRINSTTWSGLCKASEAWHRDLRRSPIIDTWSYIIRQQQGFYQAWNTALPEHKDGEYTITPLSSEYELYQNSLDMEHCAVIYGRSCAQGTSRIFSISDSNGNKLATTEIQPHTDTWIPTQTRGKKNHPVSDDLNAVAQRLGHHYQEVQEVQETQNPQQTRPWWVHLQTGETHLTHPNNAAPGV